MTDLTVSPSEIEQHADEAYRAALVEAYRLGVSTEEVLRMADAAYDAVIDAAWEAGA